MKQLVRTLIPIVMLTLAGFVLGCSEDQGASKAPPTKEESKKIAEETKNAMMEAQKARRAQKGRGPG